MRQLMAKGANVNAADMEGETPLIRAALMGHLDALMVLTCPAATVGLYSHACRRRRTVSAQVGCEHQRHVHQRNCVCDALSSLSLALLCGG